MRAFVVPPTGEPLVMIHPTWDREAVEHALSAEELVSYNWPHPPKGRAYTVFHPLVEGQFGRLSLIQRRPSVVLGRDARGDWKSLSGGDLLYITTVMTFEQRLLQVTGSTRKELS